MLLLSLWLFLLCHCSVLSENGVSTFSGAVHVGHTDTISSLAFTPDGHAVLSAGNDGTVRVWQLLWDYEFPADVQVRASVTPFGAEAITQLRHKGDDAMQRGDYLTATEKYGTLLRNLRLPKSACE